MIPFERLELYQKERYDACLAHLGDHGCEYGFANKFLRGRQKAAFMNDHLVVFAQFDRRSIYLFPIGCGDPKPVPDATESTVRTPGGAKPFAMYLPLTDGCAAPSYYPFALD